MADKEDGPGKYDKFLLILLTKVVKSSKVGFGSNERIFLRGYRPRGWGLDGEGEGEGQFAHVSEEAGTSLPGR